MKKLFSILAAVLLAGSMMANTYYLRGDQNNWGATALTVSADGLYEYIAQTASTSTNKFKIALSATGWDYDCTYSDKEFNSTNITNMNDASNSWNLSGNNNGIYEATNNYYVIVYYPNTRINQTTKPVICASTTLPSNTVELRGDKIGWSAEDALPFVSTDGGKTYTLTTTFSESQQIKVVANNQGTATWFGKTNGKISVKSTSLALSGNDSEGNVNLDIRKSAEYTLTYVYSTKTLSVAYPATQEVSLGFALTGTMSETAWEPCDFPVTYNLNVNNDGYLFKVIENKKLVYTEDGTDATDPYGVWMTCSSNDEYYVVNRNWQKAVGFEARDGKETKLITDLKGDYIFYFDPETYTVNVTFPNVKNAAAGVAAWDRDNKVQEGAYHTTTAIGNHATICLPYSCNVTGANIYQILGKDEVGFVVADFASEVNSIEAGKPYIYFATENEQVWTPVDDQAADINNEGTYLFGSYTRFTLAEGSYFLYMADDTFHPAGENVNVIPFRATLDYANLPSYSGEAPIRINVLKPNPIVTGVETAAAVKATKTLVNGRVIILRDGKAFDARGNMLK